MTPLQEKFLKAINSRIKDLGYGHESLAKSCEEICIEEMIELIDDLLQVMDTEEKDVPKWLLDEKERLQNELKNQ